MSLASFFSLPPRPGHFSHLYLWNSPALLIIKCSSSLSVGRHSGFWETRRGLRAVVRGDVKNRQAKLQRDWSMCIRQDKSIKRNDTEWRWEIMLYIKGELQRESRRSPAQTKIIGPKRGENDCRGKWEMREWKVECGGRQGSESSSEWEERSLRSCFVTDGERWANCVNTRISSITHTLTLARPSF